MTERQREVRKETKRQRERVDGGVSPSPSSTCTSTIKKYYEKLKDNSGDRKT